MMTGQRRYQSARGRADGRLRFTSRRGLTSLADEAGAPPLWWPAAFGWPVGTAGSGYRFRSIGGAAMAADPVPPTTRTTTLRTGDALVPFALDFAPDLAAGDTIEGATVTVWAAPIAAPEATPTDVTAAILQDVSIAGTSVVATLGQANARAGTRYAVRIVAHLGSGEALQESIDDVECDE